MDSSLSFMMSAQCLVSFPSRNIDELREHYPAGRTPPGSGLRRSAARESRPRRGAGSPSVAVDTRLYKRGESRRRVFLTPRIDEYLEMRKGKPVPPPFPPVPHPRAGPRPSDARPRAEQASEAGRHSTSEAGRRARRARRSPRAHHRSLRSPRWPAARSASVPPCEHHASRQVSI